MCAQDFTEDEVTEAIQRMHPLIALGPDGLPALFYQKYWHIVGTDIIKMTLDILNNNAAPDEINKTFICLIPKCKNPTSTCVMLP